MPGSSVPLSQSSGCLCFDGRRILPSRGKVSLKPKWKLFCIFFCLKKLKSPYCQDKGITFSPLSFSVWHIGVTSEHLSALTKRRLRTRPWQLPYTLWAQVISILVQATDRLVARQPRWSPALPCASTIPWICQNCSYLSELVEFANKKVKWSVAILFTNYALPNWQNIGHHVLVSKK